MSSVPLTHKFEAMEGVFYTNKTGHHAHTNAAKAGLNMLTRTVAEEWAEQYEMFVTAVDTGWCTDEKTMPEKIRVNNNDGTQAGVFSPPLDCEDGAARVVDPIFSRHHLSASEQLFGVFLKDYNTAFW
jgi:NAD(P)-dependent dehydrogenase (short-subunit alcohol dehydrogenase family)